MKLVQMPTALLRVGEADLEAAGLDPGLLATFRAYLPHALPKRRGLLILASPDEGGHHLLMLLARRVGAALRDANIHLRDRGGDLKTDRQKLCYLPGDALITALGEPNLRRALAEEAACFVQDLDGAWPAEAVNSAALGPEALRSLLDERTLAGCPTFLQAAPGRLPPDLETALRDRLTVLEAAVVQAPGERSDD